VHGKGHPSVARALAIVARCDLDEHSLTATAPLEEALRSIDKPDVPAGDRGEVRFELARALWAAGAKSRSRSLATQAERELALVYRRRVLPEAKPDDARDGATPPDWIAEAWRVFVGDLLAFLRTSAALLRHPRRFSSRWATGQARALNPLAFMATSAALFGAAQALFVSDGGDSLVAAALALVAPYAHFAWLGLIAHGALRLLGSRQQLRASLAAALYVGG